MALTLQNLYAETKNKYQLSLIAGESGLGNIMSWVYVSEDLNTADFLQGGELVITTGVSSSTSKDWLFQFMKTMILHHTSGLIINVGKYIQEDDITEEMISFCESNQFPLFIMPWKIHIYDISRDYCNRIFIKNQEDSTLSHAFLSIIRQDSDYAKSINIIEDHGYPMSSEYLVCVIDITSIADRYAQYSYSIHSVIRKSKVKCQLLHLQTKLILVCNDEHYERICQLIEDLHIRLTDHKKDLTIHEGVGGLASSLKRINTSFSQANAALSMAHFQNKHIFHYNNMGFFKLLLAVNDKMLLHNYADNLIGKIQTYDQIHNSNYMETLRSFLLNDGSIQAVANELFCHRNTINYRIHTLKETFNLKLDEPSVRYDLTTAFLILDYLKLDI